MTEVNRAWRLVNRPSGNITPDVLQLKAEPMPVCGAGQVEVRLNYLSLDPTNRMWMSDRQQYMPPVALGDVMRGGVCGTVTKSNAPGFAKGDVVSGIGGWSEYQALAAEGLNKVEAIGPMSVRDVFGMLTIVAPTAYLGLTDIGRPKPNETLVVSAAAGAVGSVAAQLAKSKGCRVVGLAGSAEKCAWLEDELELDGVINYKTENVDKALAHTCPQGIDIYFDNTGGAILDACLPRMNLNGRVITCGLIADYNEEGSWSAPKNYNMILMQRLTVQGFIVIDHFARYPEIMRALVPMFLEGRIKYRIDEVNGFENAVSALARLYSGENRGKQVVAAHPL